jgi:hypothetical protein
MCKAEEFRDITVHMNVIQDITFSPTKFIKLDEINLLNVLSTTGIKGSS